MKKKSANNRSAFFNFRALIGAALCFVGVALAFFAFSRASAQPGSRGTAPGKELSPRQALYRGVSPVVRFDVSPPLRDIKPIPPGPGKLRENEDSDIVPRQSRFVNEPDPVVQSTVGRGPAIPAPVISFDGQSNSSSVSPPDPNGAVGPNHVVAMANLSFQIFNKTGTSLFGPAANNTLWAGFGGPCQTENSGDPVVLYDQLADRWVLSQFTSAGPTFFNCIAVSTSPDPTGTYFRYAVSTGGNFPDYPKYGVWPDAYYISTREFLGSGGAFQGVGAYALNRAQILAGNPSPTIISFLAPPAGAGANVGDGLLPSNLDGMTPPPAGSPNYYMGSMDNNGPYGAALDALTLWKFHVDFVTPANSTFGMTDTLPTAAFNSILGLCGGGRACIPQPGTTNKIDHLGYRQRPLHRLAYRNFGDHESLVTNQSVSAGTGAFGEVSGIRWWELRSPNSSPVIYQEGTYAPGLTDGIHRWMGSIAMDSLGNMALGYSASSGSVFPSVFYTARNPGSPLGTMPLGEGSIMTGTGSQTGSNRWGDYTALSIDPTDDITFWYVNQYVPATSSIGWRLRIGSFRLIPAPALAASTATLSAEGCSPSNGTLDPGETVTVNFCVTNNGDLAANNVVGTLQNSGGVTGASGPQTYGPIAPGATVCKSFTFTASGACGSIVTASIQLQDGATNLGTVAYAFTMTGTVATSFSENFDGVVAPALPAGWAADVGINTAGAPLWQTSNSGTPTPVADSAPNAAFTQDPANLCDNRIYSPVLMYTAGSQLTFRQNFDLEENSATTAYDAGVLEIAINGGAFTDIVTAGGSFATGGYNHTGINTGFANPLLPSRPCWSGVSGGFVSVAVNLPAAGAGQSVQFRWRMGSDNSVTHAGWRIDNVAIAQRTCATNCTAPTVSTAVSRKTHPGAGDFDISMPLSGTPGIECRAGGATNDYQMVVTFASSVTVTGSPQAQVTSGTGVVGSGGVGNGGTVGVSGNTVTIPLTNVANAQTVIVTLNGVTDGLTTGNSAIPMSRLLGDTNGNRTVNASDVGQTKSRIGQLLGAGNFRSDVNVSGAVTASDVSQVKSVVGTSVP